MNRKNVVVLALAVLLHLSGYLAILLRIEPFQYFFYITAWWSYVVFIDGVIATRTRGFLVLNRTLPLLVVISSGFWCIFELINLRIENWFYINLPTNGFQRWIGYLLAYGTVIPAIYLTKELIYRLIGRIGVKPKPKPRYPHYAIPAGFAALLATFVVPEYCFPLTWIFPALIIDGYNYRKGHPSFIKDWERGSARNLVATLLSGLVCGALWETWNFWSISKWIYTVPFFESLKIFEMPVAGYLGFPIFALEVIAFVNLLQGADVFKGYALQAAAIGLSLSLFAFLMIDRHTVFSYASHIERLSFIEQEKRAALHTKGAQTSHGINPLLLNHKEREVFALIHLKGLGYDNFAKLAEYGIHNIKDLARADEETVSAALKEPNVRRTRAYLAAAEKYTRENHP